MALNDLVTGANLGPEFEVGTNVANQITIKTDGTSVIRDAVTGELSSPPGVLTYDGGTSILTYDNGQGGTANLDLSALTTDIFVNGGTFDAATGVLTLTDNDGATPDVVVDLSALSDPSADANNILVAGTDGKLFLDCATISASCTGICQDVFGNDLFRAFPL